MGGLLICWCVISLVSLYINFWWVCLVKVFVTLFDRGSSGDFEFWDVCYRQRSEGRGERGRCRKDRINNGES
jgi:hypothetical protein